MAASTGPRAKFYKPADKVAYPVTAGAKINKDTMVMLVSGALLPMAPNASGKFAGFVEGNHDNTGGALGAIPDAPVLKEGTCAVVYGPGSPTAAAVNGVTMYAADDQTVQPTQPTNGIVVGVGIYDPDPDIAGKGMIRIRINGAVS